MKTLRTVFTLAILLLSPNLLEAQSIPLENEALVRRHLTPEEGSESWLVSLYIYKRGVYGLGRLTEELPKGYLIGDVQGATGSLNLDDNVLMLDWSELPKSNTVLITYKITPGISGRAPKRMLLNGHFTYVVDGETRKVPINTTYFQEGNPFENLEGGGDVFDQEKEKQKELDRKKEKEIELVEKPLYAVELQGKKKKLPENYFRKKYRISDTVNVVEEDGIHKYRVGGYTDEKNAKDFLSFYQSLGLKEAKLVQVGTAMVPVEKEKEKDPAENLQFKFAGKMPAQQTGWTGSQPVYTDDKGETVSAEEATAQQGNDESTMGEPGNAEKQGPSQTSTTAAQNAAKNTQTGEDSGSPQKERRPMERPKYQNKRPPYDPKTRNYKGNARAYVVYKVQIAAGRSRLSESKMRTDYHIAAHVRIEVINEDGQFKYRVGTYKKYADATNFKEKVKKLGVKDAYIVAFVNGKKVNVAEAIEVE